VSRSPLASGSALSTRETEVVQLVAAGLTNDQIAARLGIARRTVETQVAAASAKLGARTRSQLVALAQRAGRS
jgi:DNA-binding CsgD family transcriptional regulator